MLEVRGVLLWEEVRMRSLWAGERKQEHEWMWAAMVSKCPSLQRNKGAELQMVDLDCDFGHGRGALAGGGIPGDDESSGREKRQDGKGTQHTSR